MLSLEEAIAHCLEVAEKNEKECKWISGSEDAGVNGALAKTYAECAKEHRQMADWLKELKKWREFGHKNAQFINDCLLQNHIDELFSSEIKDDVDILRITNEALTLRTTNDFCKSFNKRFKRLESEDE